MCMYLLVYTKKRDRQLAETKFYNQTKLNLKKVFEALRLVGG